MARKKVAKKRDTIEKYLYPSMIFGLMMAAFNFVFLICSLYSSDYTGIYLDMFDSIILTSILNAILDTIVFGLVFFIDFYLLLEVIISPEKKR